MQDLVDTLLSDDRIAAHAVYRGVAPARVASFAEPASGWPLGARAALDALRVGRLYTHQAEALDLRPPAATSCSRRRPPRQDAGVPPGAARGARARSPGARAVHLPAGGARARPAGGDPAFPRTLGLEPEEAAEVYDGDTPENERRRIRRRCRQVVLTNPDMAHLALLPSHETWGGFLSRLALVVVDEAHVYRGIFGAHVHHVLRRLVRLARYHGGRRRSSPARRRSAPRARFIETLAGEPFAVLARVGRAASLRTCCPRAVRREPVRLGHARRRAGGLGRAQDDQATTRPADHRVDAPVRLVRMRPDLAPRVASYRSGYLPAERREDERRLFSGQLSGVISTAGAGGRDRRRWSRRLRLSATPIAGDLLQRIGRTGRQDRESLAVLVALPDALDRYVAAHPEHFFSGEFEKVVPTRATTRWPTRTSRPPRRSARSTTPTPRCCSAKAARRASSGWSAPGGWSRWTASGAVPPLRRLVTRHPAAQRRTRCTSCSRRRRDALGSMDESRAWFEAHPGAIYLHAGRTYRVG